MSPYNIWLEFFFFFFSIDGKEAEIHIISLNVFILL